MSIQLGSFLLRPLDIIFRPFYRLFHSIFQRAFAGLSFRGGLRSISLSHAPDAGARAKMAAPKKKIAIMTSGGDSPGMNGVVRACVRMALHMGCDAFCVYEGYEGLVQGGDFIRKMDWHDVRGYLSEGGTLIGTARCMAFYERP